MKKANPVLDDRGLGRKTLRQVADETSVSPVAVQMALRQQGIDAEPSMTLKRIAEENGIQMQELKQLLETMLEQ